MPRCPQCDAELDENGRCPACTADTDRPKEPPPQTDGGTSPAESA